MLEGVMEHNRWDVISLAALPGMLAEASRDPIALEARAGARGALGGAPADEDTLYDYLKRHQGSLDPCESLALARLARRRGEWPLAAGLWSALAEVDQPEAIERLAKYQEHRARDCCAALAFTERLPVLEPGRERHRHRARRLRGKCAAQATAGLPISTADARSTVRRP